MADAGLGPAAVEPRRLMADREAESFDHWIEAGRTERHYWIDLWRFRELLFILAWRDVAVRYKQTAAGTAWAVLQPVLMMAIMTVVFGKVAGLPADHGAPYALMVLAGMLPWQFVANALSTAGQSLINNASLISKVYFPRLIVPMSSIAVSLVDFAVTCGILGAMMLWYHVWPTWRLFTLPLLLLLAIVATLGPSLIVAAMAVRYRDLRFVLPFVVQFGLYISPVAYGSDVVRAKLGPTAFAIYSLNPIVGVIDGFRWAVFGGSGAPDPKTLWPAIVLALAGLAIGLIYFRRTERAFADVI